MHDPEFWHNKWAANQIGFHLNDVNPLLEQHWHHVNPHYEASVFVPLCGKSEDLVWLATQHSKVQGVELSKIAVRSFFAEHLYTPQVTQINSQHEEYLFDELTIYTGDYFTAPIEPVDIIYDRAALVAMPKALREVYVQRLKSLLKPEGRILLVSLDYVQQEMSGPPFSVDKVEIESLFSGYDIQLLSRDEADNNHPKIQKGLSRFAEEVWVIENHKE
ncbi:thiopurine S-methyltransferase [Vibrio sp. 10N.286.49.B3]|uniref:thiopurine S-methyltransferase n=1 Tax=Vibrio sp. 10N.286.49.B3 TaxID=1880855 RepID=UPI000C850061|nr:thiopurine S-methyltransferase [Vibrio sp. 10N.286.49.B3]PMH46588.1 thiopurine S-methyltransferase [Vibrio sp. 10N.286.49.B3]